MSKLHEIAAQRKQDVKAAKAKVSVEHLVSKAKQIEAEFGKPISLSDKLAKSAPIQGARMHVAAEFKRASPSKGAIAEDDMKLSDQVEMYSLANSSLVSVLTEPKWFKGSLEDMEEAKRLIYSLAKDKSERALVLRKDFVVDAYQLYEAVAYGADTVLLIVAILPEDEELRMLIDTCRMLGMEPLVEAANPAETKRALQCGAKVLGINNRDLTTFKLDLNTTVECAKVVKEEDKVQILALSGIKSREDVLLYEPFPVVRGILVGEHLMKCANPVQEIRALVVTKSQEQDEEKVLVKVCGICRAEDALVCCKSKVDLIGLIFAEKSPRRVSFEEAKAVVKCVRDFRETTTSVVVEQQKEGKQQRLEWFQQGANALRKAAKRGPLLVGVFQNQPMEFVEQAVREVGLDLVQFHGSETWDQCAACSVPVIKVVHVPQDSTANKDDVVNALQPNSAIAVLLDTTVGNAQGGTGQTFDWDIAAKYKNMGIPVIVAGGLVPSNVRQAIAQANVPLAVDCCSGVQRTAREKDSALIKEFCQIAKQ